MRGLADHQSNADTKLEGTRKPHSLCVFAALLAGIALGFSPNASAQTAFPLTGNLLGAVTDGTGIPQMGATVQIFNKYDRPVSKTLTSADGRFAFAGLPIDLYTVRVSLASFLPAARDKIAIKPGLDSVLRIHLATLFSSIQVSYSLPDAAMSNDWKWVLRSSPATRPVTRFLPGRIDTDADEDAEEALSAESHPRIFSGTRAMLSVSGGDGGLIDTESNAADFGTGFVVSTNILGKNQVQVGGAFGQAANLGPSAMALCAIYSRNGDMGFGRPPEVTFTMSQTGMAATQLGGMQNSVSSQGAGSGVRSMALSIYEVIDPIDNVHLEYGMTGESVEYLQHASRISPFARMTVTLGNAGELIAAYSEGGRPDELKAHQPGNPIEDNSSNDELMDAANTLARLPQLSKRDGQLELQRSQSYEIGYRKTSGSLTYAASAFYEDTSNGRINVSGNLSGVDPGDLFYDGVSTTTSTYNIGNFRREGYIASLDQRVSDSFHVALAYGRVGGLLPSGTGFPSISGVQQKFVNGRDFNVASANVDARIPRAGTKLIANYGWVDSGTIVPQHVFTTQNVYIEPGLNVNVRQPLPSLFGLPGRLEIIADLRNMLAQGYLPIDTGDGHRLMVVQSPRAFRGGLNFIF